MWWHGQAESSELARVKRMLVRECFLAPTLMVRLRFA